MNTTNQTSGPWSYADSVWLALVTAETTQSDEVKAFVANAVLSTSLIHVSIDQQPSLNAIPHKCVYDKWATGLFRGAHLINTANANILSVENFGNLLNFVCTTETTVIGVHTVSVTAFVNGTLNTSFDRDEFQYTEIVNVERGLDEFIYNTPIAADHSDGWTRLLYFIAQVDTQLNILATECPDGVTETSSEDDDEYEDDYEYEGEDEDPFGDPEVVGWGEDLEWTFSNHIVTEVDKLSNGTPLVDPNSKADKITWVTLERDMENADIVESLGGSRESLGLVRRAFNTGIVMRYTYSGYLTGTVNPGSVDPENIESILLDYVSQWQQARIDAGKNRFYIGDALTCIYGQAYLANAFNLAAEQRELEDRLVNGVKDGPATLSVAELETLRNEINAISESNLQSLKKAEETLARVNDD